MAGIQSVELFGEIIEYNASKAYGGFNFEGVYARVDMGLLLPSLAEGYHTARKLFAYLNFEAERQATILRMKEEAGQLEELVRVEPQLTESVNNTIELFGQTAKILEPHI